LLLASHGWLVKWTNNKRHSVDLDVNQLHAWMESACVTPEMLGMLKRVQAIPLASSNDRFERAEATMRSVLGK